jgi:hypothetical protein
MEIIIRPKTPPSQLENIGAILDWNCAKWYALDTAK